MWEFGEDIFWYFVQVLSTRFAKNCWFALLSSTLDIENQVFGAILHRFMWRAFFSESNSNIIFKPIIMNILSKNIMLYKHLSRYECRILSYVLTGHAPLNYFLHKFGKVDSPICDLCNLEAETAFHFLWHCPAHTIKRLHFLGDRSVTRRHLTDNVKIHQIVAFIKATKRFDSPIRR